MAGAPILCLKHVFHSLESCFTQKALEEGLQVSKEDKLRSHDNPKKDSQGADTWSNDQIFLETGKARFVTVTAK